MDTTYRDDWGTYEADFREDWEERYGGTGRHWEDYEPHYRYGHDLWGEQMYEGKSWDEIEPHVRQGWEERFKEGWDEFKEAVRHGWETLGGVMRERQAA